jgi:hypothetical protein
MGAPVGIAKDEDLGLLNNSKRGFWLFTMGVTAISLIINQTHYYHCVYTIDGILQIIKKVPTTTTT